MRNATKYILITGIILCFCTACFDAELKTIVFTGNIVEGTVSEIGVSIQGVVISQTGAIEALGHCWTQDPQKTPDLTNNNSQAVLNLSNNSFQSDLYGLAPNSTYYIRGYAKVNGDVVYGKTITFKTIGESKPAIVTISVGNIAKFSASAMGRINDISLGSISKHGHCWVIADVFNQVQPTVNNFKTEFDQLTNPTDFESNLTELAANTKYRVCSYAIINGVARYGNIINFTTIQ